MMKTDASYFSLYIALRVTNALQMSLPQLWGVCHFKQYILNQDELQEHDSSYRGERVKISQ